MREQGRYGRGEMTIKCPKCDAENPNGTKTCCSCGFNLSLTSLLESNVRDALHWKLPATMVMAFGMGTLLLYFGIVDNVSWELLCGVIMFALGFAAEISGLYLRKALRKWKGV